MAWMMKSIDRVYTGRYAEDYDLDRTGSERWAHEDRVIRPLLAGIRPGQTVLDIAAGTGRWLPAYREVGAKPILLDSSIDMLRQAEAKAEELGFDVSVRQQSALSAEPFPDADWAVSTRFFNWIPLPGVESVLRKLLAARVQSVLFTITFEPADLDAAESQALRRRMRTKNLRSLLRLRKKGVYHLHRERDVRSLLARLGLSIDHEDVILEAGGRRTVAIRATPLDRQ